MQFKTKLFTSLSLSTFICHIAFANDLTIYVAKEVQKCISFNLVKIDQPTQINNNRICAGDHGKFNYLADGQYRLFGMEVDTLPVNPYGDSEYIISPILLSNDSSLSIYYPSRFPTMNYQSNIIGYPKEFRMAK